ncbi:MAG: 16S rRNA (adenine(1518)-N(6)/adenine(1519)-N(6))-dimethyltransferase RsmA [Armatimonadota bacterium]|nr:16S rRNA (adenine(1518)-N(6)/adenine(1519)-N(6))-dimethyltransferase RsmA [Armatimonadota bacterium]
MKNLASPRVVRELLAEYGLRPKKRLSQHFLVDANILRRIANAAEVGPGDHVLEIGTGLGTLTRELAKKGAAVVSVEVDRSFQPLIEKVVTGLDSVEVVFADFLKLDLEDFLGDRWSGKWVLVGNLPYSITSPLITKTVSAKHLFSKIVVTVQKEVAQRLSAEPGSDQYGALTVFVQYYCEVEQLAVIPPSAFFPVPEVESALVRLKPRERPAVDVSDEQLFFAVVRSAFGKRRKTLLNALSSSPVLRWNRDQTYRILSRTGIDPSRRGETLSLGEFARLADAAAVLEKSANES